jgi:outer membrane receptor protein involved in Fe transport
VGLRTELARQELSSYHINDQPLRESQRWLDWLPTVTLLVQVMPQLQLRGAFFRSVTRPTFRERAPFAFFDVTQQSLFQGNPLLEPARAWNGELRGEWYFSPGEFLSLGGFVKRITKAIEETIFPQQSELTRTVANAVEPARLLGAELEFRKRLSMLGAVGQQLVLFGNASLVYGRVGVRSGGLIVERQLWGQAPYSLNLGLLWQTPFGGELSFVWNRIGRRIVEVAQPEQYSFPDPHVYELPFDALDATYRQPLPGGVSLSLKAKNLLGQAVRWEQGGIEVYRQPRPRSLSLSIGYKLP